MAPLFTQLTLGDVDGRTASFTYGLSATHGWEVRAQLDDRIVVRHCHNWRGVERLYQWFRMASREPVPGSVP